MFTSYPPSCVRTLVLHLIHLIRADLCPPPLAPSACPHLFPGSPVLQSAGSVPAPCPRSGHTSCLLPDARGLVIVGGIDFASEAVYNDVHVLDTGKYTHHDQ